MARTDSQDLLGSVVCRVQKVGKVSQVWPHRKGTLEIQAFPGKMVSLE